MPDAPAVPVVERRCPCAGKRHAFFPSLPCPRRTVAEYIVYTYKLIIYYSFGALLRHLPDSQLLTAVPLWQNQTNFTRFFKWESYEPYLGNLISWLRENAPKKNFKLAWHQTWAYSKDSTHKKFPNYGNDQTKMYNAIVDCVKDLMKEYHFDILIPSGTAIQNARTSSLGDTFNRDGYHLERTYGRYTAACT